MNEVDKLQLLELAHDSIEAELEDREPDTEETKHLDGEKTVFVKLTKHRNLRGGMGVLSPTPLYKAVMEAARKAAFEDPRFTAVEEKELKDLNIRIFVINEPEELEEPPETYPDQIEAGEHGLILRKHSKTLMLPHIAEEKNYTETQFLNALCQKAGLSFNAWKDERNKVYKFTAETFSE